MDEACTLR